MLEKEYDFYKSNKDDLVKKYNNKIIVIQNNEIIGVYNTKAEALQNTTKEHKIGTFLVQEIKDTDEPVIRFYSRVYAQ